MTITCTVCIGTKPDCPACKGSGVLSDIKDEKPKEQLGTPLSEISGRPGHKGFAEFCRIAESWGFN